MPTDRVRPTPSSCRQEAARQQRLANEAEGVGDWKKFHAHQSRSIELDRLAFKLEADEQNPNGESRQ